MNEQATDPPEGEPDSTPIYTLTVEEASALFAEAGTPRSPRTIIRYCAKGHLGCIKADTQQNERYLISRESVDQRIAELKQLAVSRHDQSGPDTSGHGPSSGGSPEGDAEKPEAPGLRRRVGELEQEVRDLQITNRAKDYVLDRYESERTSFIEQLTSKSRRIGELETRLQIAAPRDDGVTSASAARHDGPGPSPAPQTEVGSNDLDALRGKQMREERPEDGATDLPNRV